MDFSGEKLSIVDRKTRDIRKVGVFLVILGASHLTYIEAAKTKGKEDCIKVRK